MMARSDYKIGLITALPVERAAMEAMLDERHADLPNRNGDDNMYTFGKIGNHKVVMAGLPKGVCGTTSATAVAIHMKTSFESLRFALMVGVAGGAPSASQDIRLGDVVVSNPTEAHPGVIQYDYGKDHSGEFKQTGVLNKPPTVLLTAIGSLDALHHQQGSAVSEITADVLRRIHRAETFSFPGLAEDRLFHSAYKHVEGNEDHCQSCDPSKILRRRERPSGEPSIFYGLIASANRVLRNSTERDTLSKKHGILCFEMEAAGLIDVLPCLVIRGISDYCDSHKNKKWHGYAALNAAAYARELLYVIPSQDVAKTPTIDSHAFYVHKPKELDYPWPKQYLALPAPSPETGLSSPKNLDLNYNIDVNHRFLLKGAPPRVDIFPYDYGNERNHSSAMLPHTAQHSEKPSNATNHFPHEDADNFEYQSPVSHSHTNLPGMQWGDSRPPENYNAANHFIHEDPEHFHYQSPFTHSHDNLPRTEWGDSPSPENLNAADGFLHGAVEHFDYQSPFSHSHDNLPRMEQGDSPSPQSPNAANDFLHEQTEHFNDQLPIAHSHPKLPRMEWGDSSSPRNLHSSCIYNFSTNPRKHPNTAKRSEDAEVLFMGIEISTRYTRVAYRTRGGQLTAITPGSGTMELTEKGPNRRSLSVYLGALWTHITTMVGNDLGLRVFNSAKKRLVFTLPDIWADIWLETFQLAVKLSPILTHTLGAGHTTMSIIGGYTAAAEAIIYESSSSLSAEGSYIVCLAADNGTAVTTYRTSRHDALKIRTSSCSELEEFDGYDVNAGFETLLRRAATSMNYALSDSLVQDVMQNEWEGRIKPMFQGRYLSDDYQISMSSDDSQPLVSISAMEVEEVFDPIINGIGRAIDAVMLRSGHGLKGLIIAGSLGASPYVFSRLERQFSLNVPVITAKTAPGYTRISAACRGAIYRAMLKP